MSARRAYERPNDEPMPAQANAAHIVSLASPSVARAIVAELLMRPDALSEALRSTLQMTNGDDRAMAAALERMTVWADLSSLVLHGLKKEERQWRQAALTYCVLRRANFSLLHRLFKVTRAEVAKLRIDHGVMVETRPKAIADSAVQGIFDVWQDIGRVFEQREADRWIALAERFPQYGLNSLYQLIIKEAQS